MEVSRALVDFGLSPRQCEIYLALRKNGALSVLELAKKTGIPRVSVYSVIDELTRLGVISKLRRNGRNLFEAHAPRMLLQILKDKSKFFEQAMPLLEAFVPSVAEDFSFDYYVGFDQSKQGQRDFYDYLAREKVKLVRSFAHPELAKKFPKFVPIMIEKRNQMGIATQLLVSAEKKSDVPSFFGAGNRREMRHVPPRFAFNCNCLVAGSSTLLILTRHKEPVVILIRSASVSGLLNSCFCMMWEQAVPN